MRASVCCFSFHRMRKILQNFMKISINKTLHIIFRAYAPALYTIVRMLNFETKVSVSKFAYISCSQDSRRSRQQLHLTTPSGSGLRQIKYFKLNRGRRSAAGARGCRKDWWPDREGGRGGPRGESGSRRRESGAFSFLICLSSFSSGRREFSFYNKGP